MVLATRPRWLAIGALLLVAIAADSLVPTNLQIRLGLHWLIEHFLAYFVLTLVFCLAWPRPFIVALVLIAVAGAIEASQGLTSDRIPDLATAFCGAAGVAVGALLASLMTDMWRKGRGRARSPSG
jgi:VanZ family protein